MIPAALDITLRILAATVLTAAVVLGAVLVALYGTGLVALAAHYARDLPAVWWVVMVAAVVIVGLVWLLLGALDERDDARQSVAGYRIALATQQARLDYAVERLEELDDDGSEMARVLSAVPPREECH